MCNKQDILCDNFSSVPISLPKLTKSPDKLLHATLFCSAMFLHAVIC